MDDTKPYATKIAVITLGNVDSGKSSLIGVLISNQLDNGNGSARALVANHKHEIDDGRTSSVSSRTAIFGNNPITFGDLPGHEKYLRTTVRGMTVRLPDYGILVVNPANGITKIAKEHLALALSQNIPIITVITHIDSVPYGAYEETVKNINLLFKRSAGKSVITHMIGDWNDQELLKKDSLEENIKDEINKKKENSISLILKCIMSFKNGFQNEFPIVSVSNKTGFYIDVLKSVLSQVEPRPFWTDTIIGNNKMANLFKSKISDQYDIPEIKHITGSVFYVDKVFNPPGIGIVLSGINRGKKITKESKLFIGPIDKKFVEIKIRSFHNDLRQNIDYLEDHDRGCIALSGKPVDKKQLRGGIVIVSADMIENMYYHFDAAILLFAKSLTLKNGYTPTINCGTIRQSARVTQIYTQNDGDGDGDINISSSGENNLDIMKSGAITLKSGEAGIVQFKFKVAPEFIEPYNLFAFRSGEIHGIGMVLNRLPINEDSNAKPDPNKSIKFGNKQFKKPSGLLKKT